MNVVVVVKNGAVTHVLTDHANIRVVVLDNDTAGCDDGTKVNISTEDVALDAMSQGLATVAPAEVASIFGEVKAELQELSSSKTAAEIAAALFQG